MRGIALPFAVAGIVVSLMLQSMPAMAQATRTWVSGVGDDVNPCSRTAPCKTFAGAISKTAAGGIINCLDPGGFGAVTITKSMTIDCASTMAGVLASNTNGVVVSVASSDIVTLRGLTIDGATTGLIGISHVAGGALHVENCVISGFRSGSALGIRFAPTSAAELYVSDSRVNDNGSGASGAGIQIRPTGTGSAKVVLRRLQVNNNSLGIVADGSGGTGLVRVQVVDILVAGSSNAGVTARTSLGGPSSSVFIDRSSIVTNGTFGLFADGANAQVIVSNSTIADNDVGVGSINGGQRFSYITNNINANLSSDGTPLPNVLGQN